MTNSLKNTWQIEAEAASKTIERMVRQFSTMRRTLEAIAKDHVRGVLDDQATAQRALDRCRQIDEELWKK